MNGKGDKRRPEDRAKIDANWDRIFKSGSKMAPKPIEGEHIDKGTVSDTSEKKGK
jgi:hypothetical protein